MVRVDQSLGEVVLVILFPSKEDSLATFDPIAFSFVHASECRANQRRAFDQRAKLAPGNVAWEVLHAAVGTDH